MSLLLSNMVRLKRFLRKYPWIYSQIQKMYYRLLYVGETGFFGSKIHSGFGGVKVPPLQKNSKRLSNTLTGNFW